MNYYGNPITKLIEQLAGLPGIGGKSAQRLAFYIIHMPEEKVTALANAILDAKKEIKYCSVCCNLTDEDPCPVCENPKRDHTTIMVVEDPRDMAAYERTKQYHGVYHVLHGAISPMTGVTPADIHIKELVSRMNRRCTRSQSGNQSKCGRRGNGDVYQSLVKTLRCKSDTYCKWCACGRRFGICRNLKLHYLVHWKVDENYKKIWI